MTTSQIDSLVTPSTDLVSPEHDLILADMFYGRKRFGSRESRRDNFCEKTNVLI